LVLCSLTDIAFLPVWIAALASRHGIPTEVQLPMNLCLEEAVTNVILHGYKTTPGGPVTLRFMEPRRGQFMIVVEDEAPYFNPLSAPELPSAGAPDACHVGGQGIRLMRRFSASLFYEAMATGNRLGLGFSVVTATAKSEPISDIDQ
jgi:serine/threonine-protein kinase RsbW